MKHAPGSSRITEFYKAESHLNLVPEIRVDDRPHKGPEQGGARSREASKDIRAAHVWLMAFSVGAIVANIYYIQPLLSTIAADFRISVPQVGIVAMLTQFGAAVGMLLFVPLGDAKERRGLIVSLLLGECVCLALMASAQNFVWLALASFGIGITTATVHVIVPFAAHLASPARRGATIGAILGGLLFGILLARTFSGLLGAWVGWRAIYWLASGLMLVLAVLIRSGLPESKPELQLSWPSLIRSSLSLSASSRYCERQLRWAPSFFVRSAPSGRRWCSSWKHHRITTEALWLASSGWWALPGRFVRLSSVGWLIGMGLDGTCWCR
jgi:MFS family permease